MNRGGMETWLFWGRRLRYLVHRGFFPDLVAQQAKVVGFLLHMSLVKYYHVALEGSLPSTPAGC
jgi:hypothetical protein